MTDHYFGQDFDAHKWLGPPILLLLLVWGGVGGYIIAGEPGAVIGFVVALAFGGWLGRRELRRRRRAADEG